MSPDTVVLIHGLWMTPRSWEGWVPYLEAKGYRVLAPGYPGFEVEVEALREDPSVIAELTVPQTVAHLGRRDQRARAAADHDGPLLRRHAHPAAARPRAAAPRAS